MLLKNGHMSSHGKQSIRTFHTCPFDSLFAVIAALYADHENIKNQINQLVPDSPQSKKQIDQLAPDSTLLSMIYKMFNGIERIAIKHNALLRQRNLLLRSIFKGEEYECGLFTVDCQANVNYIVPKLLPLELYSYRRTKQCNRCNDVLVSNRCFVDINFEQFEQQSIQNLNSCLLDTLLTEEPSPAHAMAQESLLRPIFPILLSLI